MYNWFRKKFSESQHIAAIDVGSNAIRLVVGEVDSHGHVTSLERLREPIRLGGDVFDKGSISEEILEKAMEAFQKFRDLIDVYDVDSTWAVATSAVREADNGNQLVERVKQSTGINIDVIDGHKEAELVYQAVKSKLKIPNEDVLIMDIGGGSVEFINVEKGAIKEVTSLPFGTVRMLKQFKKSKGMKSALAKEKQQIQKFANTLKSNPKNFIGTGGNIVCMGNLRKQLLKKSKNYRIRHNEVKKLLSILEPLGYEGRMEELKLRSDRADVIMPALHTVSIVMEVFDINEMQIPQVGLRDGLLLSHSGLK